MAAMNDLAKRIAALEAHMAALKYVEEDKQIRADMLALCAALAWDQPITVPEERLREYARADWTSGAWPYWLSLGAREVLEPYKES